MHQAICAVGKIKQERREEQEPWRKGVPILFREQKGLVKRGSFR